MDYIIRKLEEKDLATLVELCKNHAEYEQATYKSIGKEKQLKNAIFSENPKLYCCVIDSGTELVGYFSYTFDFSTWDAQTFLYLDCLYLEPTFRGLRIGEIVFYKLKEIAKLNDCINIQWHTPIFNDRAIKFYNRIGGTGKNKIRFFIDIQQAE
jgi:ribosomal protein S18 acetylase RimI-like enzyme